MSQCFIRVGLITVKSGKMEHSEVVISLGVVQFCCLRVKFDCLVDVLLSMHSVSIKIAHFRGAGRVVEGMSFTIVV